MRWLAPLLLALLTAPVAAQEAPDPPQGTWSLLRWYVAPDGDDAADGLRLERAGKRGPFRTLKRAFEAVRAAREAEGGRLETPVRIELARGTHFLDEPLLLTADDCVAKRFGLRVCNAQPIDPADPATRVVISGGTRITGWRREALDGRDCFVADVKPLAQHGSPFRELWIDGERRPRARHPDRGYLAVAAIDAADAARPWNEPVAAFTIAGDCAAPLQAAAAAPRPDGTLADVVVACRWIENHCRVERAEPLAADEGGATATAAVRLALRDPTIFKLEAGDLWYAEGARAFLDAPGEWWLDEANGRLWVVAKPGEELEKSEVIAPRLTHLVELAGDPERGRFVEGIHFEDLDFRHCEWWFAPPAAGGPRASGFPQAAVGVPAALRATFARECSFDRCRVEHVGSYAVALGRGCSNLFVRDSLLRDLGGGGVKAGEMAIAATDSERCGSIGVLRCRIVDGGRLFHSAVGIWGGQSPLLIAGNEIGDFLYSGISLGWTWGYGAAAAAGSQVVGNAIHHIGRRSDGDGPLLSDMGGIYTLGAHDGTVIEGNWFHDVAARNYGGWGIYFDEGTARIVARSNVVERTTHGGFHQHYGRDNLFEQNLLVDGRDAQLQRTRVEEHRSFTFCDNVVVWSQGELLAGDFGGDGVDFADNVYWRRDGGEVRFAGATLSEWQARGRDVGSCIAEPGFEPRDVSDWCLVPGEPASLRLDQELFGRRTATGLAPWSLPWWRKLGIDARR